VTEVGLLGAGSHAREVAECAHPARVAFFAVEREYLNPARSELVDIDTADSAYLTLSVVAAVGAPGLRRRLVTRWGGTAYARAVSSHAWVSPSATLEDGVVILAGAAVSAGVHVGGHAVVNLGATISHDSRLGAFATLSPGAHVAGGCVLGQGVFLGVGAVVSNGVSIADGVVVGAGAVVLTDLDELGTYVGIPARKVRERTAWLDSL
jgi:sugar O-acyltransferase (sialic acid O-acetyltransferase NeuD family)